MNSSENRSIFVNSKIPPKKFALTKLCGHWNWFHEIQHSWSVLFVGLFSTWFHWVGHFCLVLFCCLFYFVLFDLAFVFLLIFFICFICFLFICLCALNHVKTWIFPFIHVLPFFFFFRIMVMCFKIFCSIILHKLLLQTVYSHKTWYVQAFNPP